MNKNKENVFFFLNLYFLQILKQKILISTLIHKETSYLEKIN